jgi:hypothetical protein
MKTKTASWFETKVRYEKELENGMQKFVTEQYVVEALSFTEAEAAITKEMSLYIRGEFKITDIRPATYGEIHFCEAEVDDKWYKAKLQFIILDEKTEKEKVATVIFLVQAGSVQGAVKNVTEVMSKTASDYTLVSVIETKIMDVYEHALNSKAEVEDKPEYE